jgi:DNA topoisomerase III
MSSARSISIAPEPMVKPAPVEKKENPKRERKPKIPKESLSIDQLHCPKCKTHLLKKGHSAYGCANYQVCGFKIPFEILGKKLSDQQIIDLLSKGKTGKIKGLKMPGNDQEIAGKLVMDGSFNVGLE